MLRGMISNRPSPTNATGPAADSDAPLVQRARAGDVSAFEELANRHERRVFTLALRMMGNETDAEDITQQAFLNALEHLNDFREEAKFSTWLMRIATFAALRVLRKRRGLPTVSLEAETEADDDGAVAHPEYIADWRENPLTMAGNRETARLIEQALGRLEERYRAVFLLRDVEGFSVRETAEALGISEGNVKVRLLRARLQLRERLTQWFGDETRRVAPDHDHHGAD